MLEQTDLQKIRDYLSQNKLEEAIKKLNQFIKLNSDRFKSYEDELVILSGKLEDLNRNIRLGVIGDEERTKTQSKTSLAILGIVNGIEKEIIKKELKPRRRIEPVSNKKSKPIRTKIFIYGILGLGILASIVFMVSKDMFDPKDISITLQEVDFLSKDEQVTFVVTDTISLSRLGLTELELPQYKIYPLVHPIRADKWYAGNPEPISSNWIEVKMNLGGVGRYSAKHGEIFNAVLVLTNKEIINREIPNLKEFLDEGNYHVIGEVRNITVKRN